MPRDIRHSTPAFETLRFVASVCLSRLSRQTRRDFSGYEIGKRRKLSVVPHIALDMAKELLRAVNITDGDQAVAPEAIASKIEAVLLGIPDKQAFRLASIATEEREALTDDIADQVRDAILAAYTVKEIEREQNPPPAMESNGWMAHECIKLDEKPRYKWRHTWAGEKGDDFVGYDGATCLGRVFRLDYTMQSEKWFWLVEHVPLERPDRACPSAGWEWGAREAACRVEKCYEAIMRLNGKRAA
ncbi:hypothetical protein FHT86_007054 [Rhizobium sp. BK313]|uniref:hypothetical protein n=1 Tax=Rhizobium sp. BK313 TaxID=2587081 RepID=UPI00105C5583|nr:hypothetical protein [Rhizobium sp. BK313]MBB3458728.1 hypothetical protein [Rhizobium sp. BK313]